MKYLLKKIVLKRQVFVAIKSKTCFVFWVISKLHFLL